MRAVEDDIVEAIKTVNLVKSAAQMLRRELPVRSS